MAAQSLFPVGRDFFFKWSAVTAVGWSIWVLLLPTALLGSLFSLAFPMIAWTAVPVMIVNLTPGISVGLFQWLILRQYIRHASLWFITSIIGSILAAVTLMNSYTTARGEQGVMVGISIGAMQWLVLSRWRWRSMIWPLVSTVSWALSWHLLFDSLYLDTVKQAWAGALDSAWASILALAVIPGIVLGSTTGLTLVWLLRNRTQQLKPLTGLASQPISDTET